MSTQTDLLSPRAFLGGTFFQALNDAFLGSFVSEVTTFVSSDQEVETYRWLEEIPGLTEWTGPRPLDGLSSLSYTITNKVFTAGIKISREDMRRDKSGQIALRIRELANRAANHVEQLLTTRIEEGMSTAGQGYDGNPFFGGTHANPAFDNDTTLDISAAPTAVHGSIITPSPGEASQVILHGIQTLLGATDSQGLPMNAGARNFGVMVPVAFASAFLQSVAATSLEHGGPNPMTNNGGAFNATVVVNPYLSSTWLPASVMVWNKDAAVRPFIYQVEESPRFDFLGEGSEQSIMNRASLALTEWTGNIKFGRHTSAVIVELQ